MLRALHGELCWLNECIVKGTVLDRTANAPQGRRADLSYSLRVEANRVLITTLCVIPVAKSFQRVDGVHAC